MDASHNTTQLNWQVLIGETLRRRRAENINQMEHAALANVSVPTMRRFERGEKSLILAKALDILRVVGMLDESSHLGQQDDFVRQAYQRWLDLTDQLPDSSPLRFPDGYMRLDYYLEGAQLPSMKKFCHISQKAGGTNRDGSLWTWEDPSRVHIDLTHNIIACWHPNRYQAELDFWMASLPGRMFLMRGYPEDNNLGAFESVPPGIIIDPTVHIRRMVQSLFQAKRLASQISNGSTVVHWRGLWTGLNGRVLRSILDDQLKGWHYTGRSREVMLEVSIPLDDIGPQLADHLFPLATKFYSHFDAKISQDFFKTFIYPDGSTQESCHS